MHDVFEGEEIDKVIDDCGKQPPALYGAHVNDQLPPSFWAITSSYNVDQTKYTN